jgi:2-polyprenyl-3-methyl-5-hydroxy-6-metoxy-1,4-benzoquinol methylase
MGQEALASPETTPMKFEDYSRTFLHFHTAEIPPVLRRHLSSGQHSLVDMGAGDGSLLVSLKAAGLLDGFDKVVAVDISEERCKRLRQYTDFSVICGDATSVPALASSSFDLVLCTQVIEHVDEQALLKEITRLLKPGGIAYIASLIKAKYGWWYYRTADGHWAIDPTHLREYASREQYEAVMRRGEFAILETAVTPLRLSIIEFLLRRIIVPLFKPDNIHSFFMKHPVADWVRKNVNIRPPGYSIVETIVMVRPIKP